MHRRIGPYDVHPQFGGDAGLGGNASDGGGSESNPLTHRQRVGLAETIVQIRNDAAFWKTSSFASIPLDGSEPQSRASRETIAPMANCAHAMSSPSH